MNVFIWANCQGTALQAVLPYVAPAEMNIKALSNYMYISGELKVERTELMTLARWADVFIYQPLVASHGFLSTVQDGTDNIRSCLRKDCRAISFGTTYNDGMWPFFYEGDVLKNGRVIDRMFREGATPDDVIDSYLKGNIRFGLMDRTLDSLDLLKRLEDFDNLTIRTHDFVKDRLFSHFLFLTQNHPTTALFEEMSMQICDILFEGRRKKRDPILASDNNVALLPGRWPIDRYCIQELGLTFVQEPDADAVGFYTSLIRQHWTNQIKALNEG